MDSITWGYLVFSLIFASIFTFAFVMILNDYKRKSESLSLFKSKPSQAIISGKAYSIICNSFVVLFIFTIITGIASVYAVNRIDYLITDGVHQSLSELHWDYSQGCINSSISESDIVPCKEIIDTRNDAVYKVTTIKDKVNYEVYVMDNKITLYKIDS